MHKNQRQELKPAAQREYLLNCFGDFCEDEMWPFLLKIYKTTAAVNNSAKLQASSRIKYEVCAIRLYTSTEHLKRDDTSPGATFGNM
jgi:hypothetical protein